MKKAFLSVFIIIIIFLALWLIFFTGKSSPEKIRTNNFNNGEARNIEASQTTNATKKEGARIYFPQGSFLKGELRAGEFEPKEVVKMILQGPEAKDSTSYIPAKTRLLGFQILKEAAIVNLSKDILKPQNVGAEAEELTIYSITNTLTEFSNIKEVIIKVEGKSEGEVDGYLIEDFWGHVGLYDQPFKRNLALIKR